MEGNNSTFGQRGAARPVTIQPVLDDDLMMPAFPDGNIPSYKGFSTTEKVEAFENNSWVQLFFSLNGRISRSSFWFGHLILFVMSIVLWSVVFSSVLAAESLVPLVFLNLVSLPLLYIQIAINTKRWHDLGKSGFWNLILLIPIIGMLWLVIEPGSFGGSGSGNKYGQPPA